MSPVTAFRGIHSTRGRRLAAFGALAAVSAVAAAGFARTAMDRGPRLQLDEVSAHALPDSFGFQGASASPSGATVLWAANQSYLLVGRGGRWTPIGGAALTRPVAAALLEGDTLLEVVDAERRAVVRLALDGRAISERPLELSWRPEHAVRSGSGWVLGGRDVAGNYRVTRLEASHARTPLLVLPARRYRGTALSMQLSGAGDSVIASLASDPYAVAVVSGSGAARGRLLESAAFAVPRLPGKARGAPDPLWVSLAIHPLDRGFIRTLSDLRSDRRALVTYDGAGRPARRSVVAVPVAVVETVPERRLLLAARRTDRLEIVTYRWRWVGETP